MENGIKDDYLDMHPFRVKSSIKQNYNKKPRFSHFVKIIKEKAKDHSLVSLLTEDHGKVPYIEDLKKETGDTTVTLSKEETSNRFSNEFLRPKNIAKTKNEHCRDIEQQIENMNLESNKRTHEEMLETNTPEETNNEETEDGPQPRRKMDMWMTKKIEKTGNGSK